MKKVAILYLILFLTIGAGSLPAAEEKAESGADYIIGPGDILDVYTWGDQSLTRTVAVLPDGKITFPLIGVLTATGKTVSGIKEELEEKIRTYIPDPVLSVEVRQVNSLLIYVIGRVNNPGKFVLNSNVNVLQALSMAGGLNPFAKRDKIKVFRQAGKKTDILLFKYDDVVENNRLEQNVQLQRGDVVVVP